MVRIARDLIAQNRETSVLILINTFKMFYSTEDSNLRPSAAKATVLPTMPRHLNLNKFLKFNLIFWIFFVYDTSN